MFLIFSPIKTKKQLALNSNKKVIRKYDHPTTGCWLVSPNGVVIGKWVGGWVGGGITEVIAPPLKRQSPIKTYKNI